MPHEIHEAARTPPKPATASAGRSTASGQFQSGFKSEREAQRWFDQNIEPRLRTGRPSPEITFDNFCDLYLERHGGTSRTVATQKERLVPISCQLRHLDTAGA